MGPRVAWGHGQSFHQGRLGHREARGPIVSQKAAASCNINQRRANQRLDIFGI
jgi:hypothetical protein